MNWFFVFYCARFLVVAGGRGFYLLSECARAITFLVAFFDTVLPSASHRDPGLIGLLGSPLYKVCGAFEKLFTLPRLPLTFSPSYLHFTHTMHAASHPGILLGDR